MDDPKKSQFASWRSYQDFAHRVRHARRFVWDKEIQAFLDTVLATLKDRDRTIQKGSILYRAQRGIRYEPRLDEDGNELGEEILGFGADRMKPRLNRAMAGRANPAGIPLLYLATTKQTAISEVRPWVGSEISVAQFEVLRELRIVDLSMGHGQTVFGHLRWEYLTGEKEPDPEEIEKAVWIDIDNAFSRPVTLSDDTADYAPTQVLAELFKDAGYDGIVYQSQFGEKGFNIALFNVDDAEPINCAPYEVTKIEVRFGAIGNTWFSKKHLASKKEK